MGATIYNSDCTKGLAQNAGIQQNADRVPNELAEKIVPTFETNPVMLRRTNVVAWATGTSALATTIYTTPADRDFYLTGYDMSVSKTAAANSARCWLSFRIGGASQRVIIQGTTLTAQQQGTSLWLNQPLKLDRNSLIEVNNAVNEATISTTATIFGYINESAA